MTSIYRPAVQPQESPLSFLEMQKRKQARPGPPSSNPTVTPQQASTPQQVDGPAMPPPQVAPQQPVTQPRQPTMPAPAPTPPVSLPGMGAQPDGLEKKKEMMASAPGENVGAMTPPAGTVWEMDGQGGQPNVPYHIADGKYVLGYNSEGGGSISQAAYDAGYRAGDPYGKPSGGSQGQPQQPAQPPPNPAWGGWSPGMNPFAPNAGGTPYTGGMVDGTVAQRYSGATDPVINRMPVSGGSTTVTPDGGFDMGEYIRNLLGGSGQVPQFNPGGPTSGSYKPPGATDRIESPEFDYRAPSTDAGTESLIAQLLGRPSAYDDEVIKTSFDRLAGGIDDEFDIENERIREEMVRRGLGDSTVYGGRLDDSNVRRRSAKTELGERILDTAAQTRSADMQRAINAGMGRTDQAFAQQRQKFDAAMQSAGFNAQESQRMFDNALRQAQFGREGQQIDYQQALQTFAANLDARNVGFREQQTLLQLFMQYAQQVFGNDMDTARFNRDSQWRNDDLLAEILGGT